VILGNVSLRGRHPLLGYVLALVAVAVVSLFIGLVLRQVSVAKLSMLYLLAVMAAAVAFGRGAAIFASVAAFLTFDWFFVEPRHQFTVADPEEWISLLLFLLTAIVTGQLAAGQRLRAQEAQDREHEAVVLYDLVRMLSEADVETVLPSVAERLRNELEVSALAIPKAFARCRQAQRRSGESCIPDQRQQMVGMPRRDAGRELFGQLAQRCEPTICIWCRCAWAKSALARC
jgi:K+-sensing histidine kinase KdpD